MEDRNCQEVPLDYRPKKERFQPIESLLVFRKSVEGF